MFRGAVVVIVGLVVLDLQDSSVDATTSFTASPTVTPSATSAIQPAATLTVTPTPSTSAGGAPSVTISPSVTPTEVPGKKTCGSISFTIVTAWIKELYENKIYVKNYEIYLGMWLTEGFFNESSKYKDVKVSDLEFNEKEGNVGLKFKLCLVLKQNDVGYIEDKFKAGFKYNGMKVKDLEFKADGVSFKDWKAKEGECSKCSDGGGGPFIIEGTCEPEAENSCNGLKKKTEESKECVKYCDSSAAVIVMCSSILAMGILLSFSFNIWM